MATATEPIELVKSRIAQVDPQSANDEIERGDAVLIDTREPHEWDVGHLHGASLVPPASVAERVPGSSRNGQARLLYCASGNRSARAATSCRTSSGTA